MNIDFRPFLILWAVMALAVVVLIVWRRIVSQKEDDTLHVLEAPSVATEQTVVANKLEVIDKWGKIITIVAVVYGVILGAAYVYQYFIQSANTGM